MKESQALAALGALSQETRLRIIRHLVRCGSEGENAGAIGKAVRVPASGMSFHLACLEQAGLLKSKRVSRQIIYRVDFKKMGGVVNYLLTDCCQNEATVLACCGIDSNDRCC